MLKKIFVFLAALTSVAIIASVAAYMWFVVYFPGEAIRQESIEKTLAMESPVYYSDGQTKIGVFFQDAHRQYIPYNRLPANFVNSLIAAEDHQFFHHYGIDFPGFARAMYANIRARRIVQGGSTITQQTAKNLFKREGRSVKAKLLELLYALRLEYHYPKEKILEFYANQFYVSGNGRGLGVAARYYFDKEPEQLEIVEAAFIAGSVKRPNYYNPFTKRDETGVISARERAKERTGYVLKQMYNLGMISAGIYQKAIDQEIPFSRGKMRFRLNTVMDLVKDGLDDPALEEALAEYGIDNVSTSGVRVITTIDKNMQKSNLHALQSELSRLDVRLLGYEREQLQKRYADLAFGAGKEMTVGHFLVARVVKIQREPQMEIHVSFANSGHELASQGIIDEQGIMPLLTSLVKYKRQRWSQASRDDLPLLLNEIQEGDLVYLSLRDKDSLTETYYFNLEKYPELQGASLVLQKGNIVALAGGMDNFYYNRAISAKRPMGSVVKPLVYAAAIQLGWNSLDRLDNERNMFVYQNNAYIPRPDHKSPHKWVSMSWAGVHSENVASVWLLYHLCDRLTPAQFKELLAQVGMGREPDESYQHYKRRVRDEMGIVVNRSALLHAAFEKAVAASEADLIFAGRQDEWQALSMLHYSDLYQEQFDQLIVPGKDMENEVRRQIVNRNFVRFKRLQQQLLEQVAFLATADPEAVVPNLYVLTSQKKSQWWSLSGPLGRNDRFVFAESYPGTGWIPVKQRDLQRLLAGMSAEERAEFWGNVRIDNVLSLATLDLLDENFKREFEKLDALPAYDNGVLHSIRDFRVLAGLKYLIGLCRAMGVSSTLEPVLSFPLGSNVISLLELARIYEALTSGMFYLPNKSLEPGLALIGKVEAANGDVIYENSTSTKRVIDAKTALAVSDILRNVVKFGTGRYARNNIRLHSIDPDVEKQLDTLGLNVPVLGKTGTANRFTNSSFAGVVPARHGTGQGVILDSSSFVLSAYVGFDDNRPMVRTTTHISGASGALPVWTKVASSIVFEKNYAKDLDMVDLAFSGKNELPLFYPDVGQIEAPVAVQEGGVAVSGRDLHGEKAPVVSFGRFLPGGEVALERYFRPYWHNMETGEGKGETGSYD